MSAPAPAHAAVPQGRLRLAALPGPVLALVAGVGYAFLAERALFLERTTTFGTAMWLAAGWAVGVLLLVPRRRWAWVMVGIAAGGAVAFLARDVPPAAVPLWTVANVAGPGVGAALVHRWRGGRPDAHTVGGLVALFVGAGLVGSLVSGCVAAVGTTLGGSGLGWRLVPGHTLSNAIGVTVAAPLLLSWHRRRRQPSRVETVAVGLVLATLLVLLYSRLSAPVVDLLPFYVSVPPVAWIALRFGTRGATIAVVVHAVVANFATAHGRGPFALPTIGEGAPVLQLQLFLLVVSLTVLTVAALAEELSDRGEVERRLQHRADHDVLTGLPNRTAATRWLEHRLAGEVASAPLTVMLCDLDGFRRINDDHGQDAGDRVLTTCADRLVRVIAGRGTVARWSGDQFLVVCDARDGCLGPEVIGEQVRACLDVPHGGLDKGRDRVRASVGLTVAEPGDDVSALLVRAEAALRRAKQLGGHHLVRDDERLRMHVAEQAQLERDLVPALRGGDVHCAYQAEVDLVSGELFAFECLARWNHPDRGPVPPDRFVAIAESTGVTGLLFETVLARALETQARWRTRLGWRPTVSVNLSARQLSDPDLAATVATFLTRWSAPACALWLEVTETAIADDPTLAALEDLHRLGVRLAIDDFGTGWSSMSRLSAFPWDALKIDRSFVSPLGETPGADHVVRAMIDMAHALGMRTVAEGVETPEQLERLVELGCDIAQGYHFGRPMDPRDAVEHVTDRGLWIPATT